MNAVAMMTPEPKYLAKKKAYSMYLLFDLRRANMGKPAPDLYELHLTRPEHSKLTKSRADENHEYRRHPRADAAVEVVSNLAGRSSAGDIAQN